MDEISARVRLRLAVFEPDRPHNFGMILRLAACLGVPVDVIEPCGFPLDARRIRDGALDYADRVRLERHSSLAAFLAWKAATKRRLVLLSTRAAPPYHRHEFRPDDILMLGSESAGVPQAVHAIAEARVRVPLQPGLRSLNIVTAGAIVLGEALRQTGGLDLPGAGETG